MIIGLTGKYCAGKNAAAAVFEEKGIPSIDVDKLGHRALDARIEEIAEAFGPEVVVTDKNGKRTVDRKALGSIVFSDPQKLFRLEKISHPWMKAETARLTAGYKAEGRRHVVVNAAILYRMELDKLCDCVIWIEAPLVTRFRRALKRDSAGIAAVIKRIYTQRQLKPKPSENSVDIYRVENRTGISPLRLKIEHVLNEIEQKGSDGR